MYRETNGKPSLVRDRTMTGGGTPRAMEGTRRDDPRSRLAQDAQRVAGFTEAIVNEATRLGLPVPELAVGCVNAWRRWARYLER